MSDWQKLVQNSRADADAPDPVRPPEEFSSSVIDNWRGKWQRLRQKEASLALWERLTLRAAILAVLVFIALWIAATLRGGDDELLSPPTIDLPVES